MTGQPTSSLLAPSALGWHWKVWVIAGPIILSNLSTPLMGAVDTAVMGHLPDPAYIGAVAVGALLFNYIFWGFGFLRMGSTGFTAQADGRGDLAELRAILMRACLLGLAFGLLILPLQGPIAALAFPLIGASESVTPLAETYFFTRVWSAPAALMNYAILGWLLGLGRAKPVFILQLVQNLSNIALSLFFVLSLKMEIEGVALASVIAEYLSLGVGLFFVSQSLKTRGQGWDWPLILALPRFIALMRVNLDIFIRTLCLVSAFALFTAYSARMGDVTLAANGILITLLSLSSYALDGFSHAAEVLTGKALGAKRRNDFILAAKVSALWAGCAALLTGLCFWVLREPILMLFTSIDSLQVETLIYLPWMTLIPFLAVWAFLLDGIFIGTTQTGEMRNAMIVSLLGFLALLYLLGGSLGNHGLWLSMALFMLLRAGSLGFYFPALIRRVSA